MKNNQLDCLQYVFACLITHSKWIPLIRQHYHHLSEFFTLSAEDYQLFYQFIKKNFYQLLTSAQLAEEKRWREMLTTIQYTSAAFSNKKLKKHWDQYLQLYSLTDPIPATPLHESIQFLLHLLKQPLEQTIRPIIEYEYFRNRTLGFEFTLPAENNFILEPIDFHQNSLDQYLAQLNPSFISKPYNQALNSILTKKPNTADYFGFYKHLTSNKVSCIYLNKSLSALLLSLPSQLNLTLLIRRISHASCTSILQTTNAIKNLHLDGLILITNTT